MSKSTRSRKVKEDPDASPKTVKVPALRKVFYIAEKLLQDDTSELKLERFFHPGKGKQTLFITTGDKRIMEVVEYAEPRRSWIINNDVCSNGKVYITTPVDVTFLALHHIRKHCAKKALALDSILDEKDQSVGRIMTTFVQPEQLKCIADMKSAGDLSFYKYNSEKTLAWLSLKTRAVANSLKQSAVYCGFSSISQNYAKSETEQVVQEIDYTRMACDIVGSYIDLDLHEELIQYLGIPTEMEAKAEEKKTAANNKRKSLQSLNATDNKKIKLENGNASEKLKNNSLIDDSEDANESIKAEEPTIKPTPQKERVLSAKEKALAKGAKGTKSIASFFKK